MVTIGTPLVTMVTDIVIPFVTMVTNIQRALKVEDVIEQEAKELREELSKLKITCKESDAKMHSQQEHSKFY